MSTPIPTKKNIRWPWPSLLAHRGAGKLAPENTLEAIEFGAKRGWLGCEFDAMLSADGVPILIHDETLERTTDGYGPVYERKAADLAAFDAGSWHSPEFSGARIPTLEAALAKCLALGIMPNIEIKPAEGFESQTGTEVAKLVDRFVQSVPGWTDNPPLLSSFSVAALMAAKDAAPHLPRGLLLERAEPATIAWTNLIRKTAARSLNIHWSDANPTLISGARALGVAVFCYTVDDPVQARKLFDMGVEGMCCDQLEPMGNAFPSRLRQA